MIVFKNFNKSKPYLEIYDLYEKSIKQNQESIEVIAISSYNQESNEVESRYVNLKYIDNDEWVFFSNYNSNKASNFIKNENISALIYWNKLNTQIRMKAKIFKSSSAFSDEHFALRSKEKNAIAISSNQSKKVKSYEDVVKNYKETLKESNSFKRPDYWGGYSFVPYYIEIWTGHKNRINKRKVFEKQSNTWKSYFLQP